MSTVKKTYEDLITVINKISLNVKDQTTKGQKKLVKISEKLKTSVEKYNEAIQDARLEHASVDDKNNLITNEKGDYAFSKEGTKAFNKAAKDLLLSTQEFPVINVVNPAGLETYTFLEGWVEGVKFVEPEVNEDDEEL